MQANDILEDVAAVAPKDYLSIALSKKVSQTDKLPRPESVLNLEHTEPYYPLFHKGSISTVSGKAKVGKTTIIALLIAAVLRAGNVRILWIDTEQGAYYANSTQFYLLKLAGLTYCENLEMYDFREFGPVERVELTEALLAAYKYDLVIVDGVRDYIFDINNPTEATNITTKLMKWSVDYDCHVCMLIHENKQGGELRGHLGSECENKSEVVLSVALSTDSVPVTIIRCKAVRGRAKFEDFFLRRDDDGLPFIDTSILMSSVKLFGDEKPKRIPLMEFRDYSVLFLTNLVQKVFEKNQEYSSTTFREELVYQWSAVWEDHYSVDDNSGSRKNINDDLAKALKKHLVAARYVTEEDGPKANQVIIKIASDEVF
jgi:hypothetical protein